MKLALTITAALCTVATTISAEPAGYAPFSVEAPHHERGMIGAIWYPSMGDGRAFDFADSAVFHGVTVVEEATLQDGQQAITRRALARVLGHPCASGATKRACLYVLHTASEKPFAAVSPRRVAHLTKSWQSAGTSRWRWLKSTVRRLGGGTWPIQHFRDLQARKRNKT